MKEYLPVVILLIIFVVTLIGDIHMCKYNHFRDDDKNEDPPQNE